MLRSLEYTINWHSWHSAWNTRHSLRHTTAMPTFSMPNGNGSILEIFAIVSFCACAATFPNHITLTGSHCFQLLVWPQRYNYIIIIVPNWSIERINTAKRQNLRVALSILLSHFNRADSEWKTNGMPHRRWINYQSYGICIYRAVFLFFFFGIGCLKCWA